MTTPFFRPSLKHILCIYRLAGGIGSRNIHTARPPENYKLHLKFHLTSNLPWIHWKSRGGLRIHKCLHFCVNISFYTKHFCLITFRYKYLIKYNSSVKYTKIQIEPNAQSRSRWTHQEGFFIGRLTYQQFVEMFAESENQF